MPDLNPYANANTADLNTPVTPPQRDAHLTSVAMSAGIQPMTAIYQGGGTNTYDPSASGGRTSVDAWDRRGENGQMGSAYTTMDVGGNVAGLTRSRDINPDKWKLDIPEEAKSEGEVETDEFIEAIDEGGKSAGRVARRANRRQDRADRQEISDEYRGEIYDERNEASKEARSWENIKEKGIKGAATDYFNANNKWRKELKANRKKRRNKRRSQLDTRKASWDMAEGDSEIED